MNFSEKMPGGSPEVEKEKKLEQSERKISTPEELEAFTRQRREEAGLGERKEFTPEQSEKIEKSINKLLENLYRNYDSEAFDSQVQDEFYYIEIEAETGIDREIVELNLRKFIEKLKDFKK